MLKLPITFNFDGTMATIAEGSDEYYAALLSNTLRIENGELPISRLYGVKDPTFEGKNKVINYVRQAAQFIPEISIEGVEHETSKVNQSVNIKVRFTVN